MDLEFSANIANMEYITRDITKKIIAVLERGKSILLLGPRQTGKTTLLEHIVCDGTFSLADVRVRLRYEANPGALASEIEALAETKQGRLLIIIDEIQKVPLLMDVAQDLIDRKIAQFILTGSSARKLRRGKEINLLPGRVIAIHMDPLSLHEISGKPYTLMDGLLYGSLPEVVLTNDDNDREELLNSYITTYLEEEIRAEAAVRNVGSFARFLELAAGESGNPINISNLSKQIGVTIHTIESYFEILVDCLIAEQVQPILKSKSNRKLAKSQKYLLFDLGVRRIAAKEGRRLPMGHLGLLFEQFIGLELIRIARSKSLGTEVRYWRDLNGPEVDWVVESPDKYTPVEVKWTDLPTLKDARHLQTFLNEYEEAETGFIVCQTPRKMKLANNIYAIPWQEIAEVFD